MSAKHKLIAIAYYEDRQPIKLIYSILKPTAKLHDWFKHRGKCKFVNYYDKQTGKFIERFQFIK